MNLVMFNKISLKKFEEAILFGACTWYMNTPSSSFNESKMFKTLCFLNREVLCNSRIVLRAYFCNLKNLSK